MGKYKVVTLVSGGIDSFIAHRINQAKYGDKAAALFLDVGQPYLEKERQAIQELIPEALIVKAPLAVEMFDNVPTPDKQEIYGRNLLMAFYGAMVAPIVHVSALSTEINVTAVRDKQPEFFHQASALFTYTLKNKQFDTVVTSPVSQFTKTALVKFGLDTGLVTADELLKTTTCYHPTKHNCGECSACFKRWIAITNNSILEKYETDPWVSPYAKNLIAECQVVHNEYGMDGDGKRFSGDRMLEMWDALNRVGISLDGQGLYGTF